MQDLASTQAATILAVGAALVNCPIVSVSSAVGVERLLNEVPEGFTLQGNYPNPFNPQTTILYSLDEAGTVTLRVFDRLGRKVVDLVDARQVRGAYQVTWDGRDARGQPVATGLYLYRLLLNGRLTQARTMTLLR